MSRAECVQEDLRTHWEQCARNRDDGSCFGCKRAPIARRAIGDAAYGVKLKFCIGTAVISTETGDGTWLR